MRWKQKKTIIVLEQEIIKIRGRIPHIAPPPPPRASFPRILLARCVDVFVEDQFMFPLFRFVLFQSEVLFLENIDVFAIALRPVVKYGPADSRSPLWSAYLRDSGFRQATTLVARRLDPSDLRSKIASSSSTSTSSPFSISSAVPRASAMLKTVRNIFITIIFLKI